MCLSECGAKCKKVNAAFEQAASMFRMEPRIWFAKMDVSVNEMPRHLQMMVKKLPTLIWYPVRNKQGKNHV